MARLPVLVGVDTGGTFTDIVAIVAGEFRTNKVPSTPSDPGTAVVRGIREILADTTAAVVTYGSTVATNALLERRGARVALVTTAGFEDALEIARQNRPALYALEPRRAAPLVDAHHRLGVVERMSHDGTVHTRLSRPHLAALLRRLERLAPESIAVCLLHSYANPKHEAEIGAALARAFAVPISVSHRIVAEHREYERASTTVVNAYVAPAMSDHLRGLEARLRPSAVRVMQSNGGALATTTAACEPVRTVLSGPAGGVMGACRVARALGIDRLLTFDMGGTSSDVALIDGAPVPRTEWEIGGLPLKVPALDIHTVGAGGGSLARVDSGGALKVGPESAGADPGPACYGHGRRATVTDANLILGRLVASRFLDGRMRLDVERARASFASLAKRLGLDAVAAAEGVVRVANASMERALRSISIERGHDPRDFSLFAFGGAAGQHACELAEALGIRRVVIPENPGLLSAWGCALSTVQRDYVQSVREIDPSPTRLRAVVDELVQRARRELRDEGVASSRLRFGRRVDLRYAGQSHELPIELGPNLIERFHAAHQRLYGYRDRSRPVEAVCVRLTASERDRPATPKPAARRGDAPLAPLRQRLRVDGRWHQVTVWDRRALAADAVIRGPALIVEFSATTVLPSGWRGRLRRRHLELRHGD